MTSVKPDYSVAIDPVEKAYFKVVWRRQLDFRPYLIDRGDIEMLSMCIRAQLGALVANALERDKAAQANDAPRVEKCNVAQREIMQVLASHCNDLFNVLFTCAPGSTAAQEYVNEHIRDSILKERTAQSIVFLVKPRVYVPWGLICDRLPSADARPDVPEDFSGFWCLRHQISTVFDALVSPSDFVTRYDSGSFHVLTGGDQAEMTKAKRTLKLKGSLAERKVAAWLLKAYGKPAASSDALVKAWTCSEPRLGLLYLFCHADARTIGFSLTDTMNVIKFKASMTKSGASPRCLVFLNGCYTTNPDESGTFLEATGRDGFCGYIGAETEVPAIFAFRYGLAFQHLLYCGKEIVEIIADLCRKHWPLSLIYGLYGFPHVRVTPDRRMATSSLPDINYSDGPLGERIG